MSKLPDEPVPTPKRKIGLKKANNIVPSVTQRSTKIQKEEFQQGTEAAFEKMEEYKKRMWDLAVQFKGIIDNKTLSVNRGPIAANLEKETLDQLIKLADDMNNDPHEAEGAGSSALCFILMKCMLLQRDQINQLLFKVETLEKAPK